MSANIRDDEMQLAEIFGRQVLYTNRLIPRDTVPDGWYCYDIRGANESPTKAAMLEDRAIVNHVGTVLSPVPLKKSVRARRINGDFFLCGETTTLQEYCDNHALEYPAEKRKYLLRPAVAQETCLFFSALDAEKDRELACVGHLRLDFGSNGKGFWTTWNPHNDNQLTTPAFKTEFDLVVNELREYGPLKDLAAMSAFCYGHAQRPLEEGGSSYGFITESEDFRYCLRCRLGQGDYNGYLYVYDKRQQELLMQQKPPEQGIQMGGL